MRRVMNFSEVYDLLIELLEVHPDVISFATCIYGRNIQTINYIIYWKTAYGTLKQWYREEIEEDVEIEVDF